jgi:hypothetical protein
MTGMIPKMPSPDLDAWLPEPALTVSHARHSAAPAQSTWRAAREVSLADTRLLGRLVRWRIPGVPADATFEGVLRSPPFAVLEEAELALLSGVVGRIWTLRRDYPELADPEEFRRWRRAGTARVLFANWVQDGEGNGSVLRSETRVQAFGRQGRLGLAGVRPLIRGFNHLIATDAMAVALRRAEAG